MEGTGKYADTVNLKDLTPQAFWLMYKDSPLYPIAHILASVPSSTGAVERVWSKACFIVSERERLSHEHMKEELMLSCNHWLLKQAGC